MLTVGDNVDKSNGIPFKNTIYREFGKVPREGHAGKPYERTHSAGH